MIEAKEAVVWVHKRIREVRVTGRETSRRQMEADVPGLWSNPIGAAYVQWHKMTDAQRAGLMCETAIDLAMQGFDLGAVLREFARVDAFRALGGESCPMCRALTAAIIGEAYDANTMSFEELLVTHAPEKDEA